jgi:hypothetical protein
MNIIDIQFGIPPGKVNFLFLLIGLCIAFIVVF